MLNKMPKNGVHVTESTESNYSINEFCVPNFYKDDLQAILVPHGLVVERIAKLAQIVSSFASR
jgi:hypoxanthine phosphoribosyltransferase